MAGVTKETSKVIHNYISHSESETFDIALSLAKELPHESVICLFGDLGAGKTTFVKGLVSAFCDQTCNKVTSPTFVFLNIYEGSKTIYHFDLYRMKDAQEFLSMGFDDYLYAEGVCCIEWSERISMLLPKKCIKVEIKHLEHSQRALRIEKWT